MDKIYLYIEEETETNGINNQSRNLVVSTMSRGYFLSVYHTDTHIHQKGFDCGL